MLPLPVRAILFTPTLVRWAMSRTGIDWTLLTFWLTYLAIFAFGVWSFL